MAIQGSQLISGAFEHKVMLNFVSPGERSASAGHQDKLLNPRRILVNPGELVSLGLANHTAACGNPTGTCYCHEYSVYADIHWLSKRSQQTLS